MTRHILLLTACAAVLALCSCASSPFNSTWTAPDVRSLNPAGKTIAVVFISCDEKARRAGEDALAEDLTARKAHGVAAYSVLPDERREGGEAARAGLQQAGVNGVVVMRVVTKDQRIRYASPASYSGFARYWDYGWDSLHQLHERSDAPLSVETLVYSLDQGGKLVWASTSHDIGPRDLDSFIQRVADATAREMSQLQPRSIFWGTGDWDSSPSATR